MYMVLVKENKNIHSIMILEMAIAGFYGGLVNEKGNQVARIENNMKNLEVNEYFIKVLTKRFVI